MCTDGMPDISLGGRMLYSGKESWRAPVSHTRAGVCSIERKAAPSLPLHLRANRHSRSLSPTSSLCYTPYIP